MLDIEKLKEAELPVIVECIDEIYDTHSVLSKVLEKFKDYLKESNETVNTDKYDIQVSVSNQLVPAVDINEIIKRYPIEQFPDMYAIKLSSIAGDVIKEQELLSEKRIQSVKFKKHGQD